MDKSNGYINASKLCSAGGRRFHDWFRLKSSHELLQHFQSEMALQFTPANLENLDLALLDSEMGIPVSVCKSITTPNISGEDRLISGTYIHPDLIPSVAGWISPVFQLNANRIVNSYLVEDYRYRLQQSEQSAMQLLDTLQAAQEANSTTQLALEDARYENAHLLDEVNVNMDMIQMKQEAVGLLEDKVIDKIREKQIWASSHAFTLLKLHDENARHPFYIIRCQGRRMSGTINKLRRKFVSAEVVYQQRKVLKAINLYSRLKEQKLVKHTHNFCSPLCTEHQLLYHLNSLCGTQHPVSNPAPFNGCINTDM